MDGINALVGHISGMSLAAHLLAARARKCAGAKHGEPHSQQPAAKRRRVAAALVGRRSVGEAARGLSEDQPGTKGALAPHTGASKDSDAEPELEADGGQAAYEALLRSLRASRECAGTESSTGSSSESDDGQALGGAAEGGGPGLEAKGTATLERARQASRGVAASRSQAARAGVLLGGGGAAADGLTAGAASPAEQLNGAGRAPAAAPALRGDGEADDAGVAWGQRMEQHFGRCAAAAQSAADHVPPSCPGRDLRTDVRLHAGPPRNRTS